MLDEIDRKIIIALVNNGRCSYIKLAKRLGIKPITVAKRVKKMLEDDVIAIRAVPNPVKMGFKVLAFIALDVKISSLEDVCNKLIDIPNISYVSTMFGKYDVILFAEYRDFDTLYHLVREEIPNIKGIKAIETFIISNSKQRYMGSFHPESSSDKHVVIDEIDEKLINELRIDGRAAFSVLASKLGVSTATVSRRVASLIKKNVIQIIAVANPTKLGHHVVAFLCLHIELDKVNEIFSRLSSYPRIPLVMTLMNGYNIIAVISLPNLDSLFKFITNEISPIDGVLNIETLIRAEFRKRTYLGFDVEEMLRHPLVDNSEPGTK
jgi:DNA-binding Lrp family transcriptional regulator